MLYRIESAAGAGRREGEGEGVFQLVHEDDFNLRDGMAVENLEMEAQIGWIMYNKSIFISCTLEDLTISNFD